jgi:hypothetical protein
MVECLLKLEIMKNTFFLIFTLLTFNFTFAQNDDWVTTKDFEKGYKIDFPSKPTSQMQPIPTAIGEIEMYMYILDNSAKVDAKNLVFMTAYTEYPLASFGDEDINSETLQDNLLDSSVSGAVSNVKGDLISSSHIRFNGYNARNAKIEVAGGFYIIMKTILVQNKLYMIQVIHNKSYDGNQEAKYFFDSFELIKTN